MTLQICLRIKNWLEREEGQDVVEYAVLVIFIVFAVLVGVSLFGPEMRDAYNGIADRVAADLN